MPERLSPLEELQAALASFIDQREQPAMFLTSFDEELPTVCRVIDGLDGESPGDVFFTYVAPVGDAVTYVDGCLRDVLTELAEINAERAENGDPPFPGPPPGCSSPKIDPYQRLQWLFAHMTTWLPKDGDHRLVIFLLAEHINNQETHARIAGTLVPARDYPPWMQTVRIVLRDDRRTPFVVDALRRTGVTGPLLYTTRTTVGDIADAVAEDAADPQLPPARRMNALMQCAMLDVALGRYEAAIEKYGVLFTFYDTHNVPELKALVVHGLGDVMSRLDRLPAARGRYLQALDLASEAKSLLLILQSASAIGEIDMRLGELVEADTSFTLGADAAQKLGNAYMQADLLEKAGEARWGIGNARGATEAWTTSASIAREYFYDERLASVLVRMRDIAQRGGYPDIADKYADELRVVNVRLAGKRVA